MAYPLSLPMTAVLAVAGVGLGVHLGRDSIAQINPSFFDRSAPSTFYASLVPNAPSLEASGIRAPQHPDAIVLDETGSCASCGLGGQAVYMADGAGYQQAYAEWSEPETAPVVQASYAYEEPQPEPNPAFEQVERYAHPPAEAEEVALAVAEPE